MYLSSRTDITNIHQLRASSTSRPPPISYNTYHFPYIYIYMDIYTFSHHFVIQGSLQSKASHGEFTASPIFPLSIRGWVPICATAWRVWVGHDGQHSFSPHSSFCSARCACVCVYLFLASCRRRVKYGADCKSCLPGWMGERTYCTYGEARGWRCHSKLTDYYVFF